MRLIAAVLAPVPGSAQNLADGNLAPEAPPAHEVRALGLPDTISPDAKVAKLAGGFSLQKAQLQGQMGMSISSTIFRAKLCAGTFRMERCPLFNAVRPRQRPILRLEGQLNCLCQRAQ